ncbi:hypothetical protein SAMN03080615_01439 [Amphritea atlantica]|uniref:Uncharacterized protein n=1 Tax=Amphritea atlantica TaxID=355243 RepID=A0A1H9FU38_9GAMM|nr:hypothetical protein SAMN03080615_01439 [Amphritea atlantica]
MIVDGEICGCHDDGRFFCAGVNVCLNDICDWVQQHKSEGSVPDTQWLNKISNVILNRTVQICYSPAGDSQTGNPNVCGGGHYIDNC